MYAGKTSWNNEGVIKAVNNFQEMINKKYFDPEGIALSNDEVKANFISGKYAFYINGTWNAASFVDIADKVQVAEFPVIDSAKSQMGELIGGPSDALAVSASSKNPDVAAMAALELAKAVCHYGYLDGNGLPAWTPDYDTSSVNPLTQQVTEIMNNAKQTVLFGDGIQSADNANVYLDYVSQIYASAIDGKAFAEGLDKDLKK
jgi:raffinose/stachyose/melibiose transport system substrate-binding protein